MKNRPLTGLLALSLSSPLVAQDLVPVNLYVADIDYRGGTVVVGTPRKLTGDRGISSQPAFAPDGKSILFIGRRDSANAQSDVYRIDLATGSETRITSTPEMENSPTVTPDGKLMVIRWVPATLFREWGPWLYDLNRGTPLEGVLPGPDTVGYYVRVDSVTFAMVRPKNPSAVAIFDTRSKSMTDHDAPVANIPPQLIPRMRAISYTRTDSLGRNEIRKLDLSTMSSSSIAPALRGRIAHVWTPDGTILMGKGNRVYSIRPGADSAWKEIAAFNDPGLQSVTTYVLSPAGNKLILISPVKPALAQTIRDSLQTGRPMSEAIAPYLSMPVESVRTRFEVSRGALNALAAEYKARRPADGPLIEALIARVAPPAQ